MPTPMGQLFDQPAPSKQGFTPQSTFSRPSYLHPSGVGIGAQNPPSTNLQPPGMTPGMPTGGFIPPGTSGVGSLQAPGTTPGMPTGGFIPPPIQSTPPMSSKPLLAPGMTPDMPTGGFIPPSMPPMSPQGGMQNMPMSTGGFIPPGARMGGMQGNSGIQGVRPPLGGGGSYGGWLNQQIRNVNQNPTQLASALRSYGRR